MSILTRTKNSLSALRLHMHILMYNCTRFWTQFFLASFIIWWWKKKFFFFCIFLLQTYLKACAISDLIESMFIYERSSPKSDRRSVSFKCVVLFLSFGTSLTNFLKNIRNLQIVTDLQFFFISKIYLIFSCLQAFVIKKKAISIKHKFLFAPLSVK